jgi:hypothetical protein
MAVANTLAYYITATITAVKSFIVQAPGVIFEPLNLGLRLESSTTELLGRSLCFSTSKS